MTRQELNVRLKEVGLNKKEFAELSGMSHGTVNNWGNDNQPVPSWADSWIENYKAKKDLDKVVEAVKPYIKK